MLTSIHFSRETEYMFYHGFDNYMRYAFPEDELRPLTCAPLTRDREHPEDVGLNDALGNYSLTLIDSLSTLAILSSSPDSGPKAWRYFQDGVADLVRLYGDGTNGPGGRGERARGFDLDSKVQVFETVIRGLGTVGFFFFFSMFYGQFADGELNGRWLAQCPSLCRGRFTGPRLLAAGGRAGVCSGLE